MGGLGSCIGLSIWGERLRVDGCVVQDASCGISLLGTGLY
jgi:hypothetical protein